MSNLYITEYQKVGLGTDMMVPLAKEGDSVVRRAPLDFSGGEVASGTFAADTRFVEVWSDADCLFAVGSDPDASVAGTPLTAKTTKQFIARAGDKISVIALT